MSSDLKQAVGSFPRGFSQERSPIYQMVRADSLVELRYGRALTEGDRRVGNVPVYGTNGRTGWHDEPLAPGPGVILGRKGMGNLGVEWCPSSFWVIDTAYYAAPITDQIDLRYFYFLIRYIGLNHLKDGTSNPTLSRDSFGSQLLPVPAIETQRAIADLLSTFDDKIEQNRRTSRKLEELVRGMFKAWFIDFEPVRAKAAGAISYPGMTTAVFATIPDRLTESSLGLIPDGWEVRPIGELVSVKGGGTPSTKVAEYWDGGKHFWATPKDLSGLQDAVLLRTDRLITDAGAECISSGVMPKDTVLLSSRAPVGYTALAKVPVAVNQGFIAMICDGTLPPHYVLHWTRSALEEIKSRASGTTFPEISKTTFRPIQVVVPNPSVTTEFECVAQSLFDLIELNARQSLQLGELRDYLLPRLLSGSVRVHR